MNDDEDGPPDPWPVESIEPDFFVLDDWYNDWAFWIKIETDSSFLSERTILALADVLRAMPSKWAVGIDVGDGYILLYADRLMTHGPRFSNCDSMSAVIATCA